MKLICVAAIAGLALAGCNSRLSPDQEQRVRAIAKEEAQHEINARIAANEQVRQQAYTAAQARRSIEQNEALDAAGNDLESMIR